MDHVIHSQHSYHWTVAPEAPHWDEAGAGGNSLEAHLGWAGGWWRLRPPHGDNTPLSLHTQPFHQLLDVTPSTYMGINAADLSISVTKANSFFIHCKYILWVFATRPSSRPNVCVHTNLISELFCSASAFSGNKEYQEMLGTNHLGPGYCLVTQIMLIVTSQCLFCNGIKWNLWRSFDN